MITKVLRWPAVCLLVCFSAFAQTTPNIGLALPPINSSNWGTKLNNNMTILDGLLSGNANVPGLHLSGNFQIPSSPGFSTIGGGLMGYDSTSNVYVGGNNTATIRFPYVVGSAPSGCAQWGANYALTGTGVACGSGGGGTPAGAFGSIQYNNSGAFGGLSLGTTTTVLHGNASGAATFGAVDLALDVTGNLGVSHLASGASASGTTFWRGDGVWATPAGGGNVSNTGTPTSGQLAIWNSSTVIQGITTLPAANVPTFTGDVTSPGGSVSLTLAPVGSSGTCGDATHSCQLTFDTKGRETARANVLISAGAASPLTTKGDLFGHSTLDARIPVGTDGKFLMADSTATLGVSYQPPFTIGGNGTLSYTGGVLDTINGIVGKLSNSETMTGLWKANIGMNFTEVASCNTPGITPSAGIMFLCADTDHNFYAVSSAGVVTALGGGGGGPTTQLVDTNSNFTIKSGTAVTSAVNGLCATNAATAGIPNLKACGSDTDIELDLDGKGGGGLSLGTGSDNHIYLGPTGSTFAGIYLSMHTSDIIHFSVTGVGDVGSVDSLGNLFVNGTIQTKATSSDPGCTGSGNIGRFWADNTTSTTAIKVCKSVAGSVGWSTLTTTP